MRGTFTVYRSVYDALIAYPPAEMKEAFRLIGEYALDGKLPDPQEGVAYGLFCSVKPLIDRSAKKADAGRRGGEASASKREAKRKQTEAGERKVKQTNNDLCDTVISYLNQKVGAKFKSRSDATRRLVNARAAEGFTEQDFRTVIDKKAAEWKGTEWAKFLRPQTLFGTKFESYLNQQAGSARPNKFVNFEQSDTDWDAISEMIMESERGQNGHESDECLQD